MTDSEPIHSPLAFLEREGLSLVVVRAGEAVFSSHHPGPRPLVELSDWFTTGLDGCTVADRVVGACAARVFARLRAGAVQASTGSLAAERVLHDHGIPYEFGRLVPELRAGDARCPLEALSEQTPNANELIAELRRRLDNTDE